MKIPGKLPLQTILKKLPQLTAEQNTELNKVISATSSSKIVSLNTKEIVYRKSKKSFSVKLINYVEPYLIKGQRYTLFYTEIDHNLKAGDRVFIESGNYDSDVLIQNNKFNKLSDGYIVQYVDRTKVVLDIEYTGELPWNEVDDDDFIKVYVASSQEEFDYLIQQPSSRDSSNSIFDNSFNFSTDRQFLSKKFSKYNSHSNNTLLYINGTFSLDGNSYGILGFTSSGSDYLTYSNSFLVYDGLIKGDNTPGYLKDVTSDILSGNYSDYLSRNLHPRINESDFVSRDYIHADQRDISYGFGFPKLGSTTLFLWTDKPHNVTSGGTVSLTLSNLKGSGSLSVWENTFVFTSAFGTGDQIKYLLSTTIVGSYTVGITSGLVTKDKLSSGDESIYNNGSIKVFNSDFEISNIKFKKDYTYSHDGSTWKVDRKYLRPYITEQNFRNGVFKKGEFNQGLLGTHLEKINYNGVDVKFTLGSVINTKWIDGNIGKGVGNDLSYFTSFDEFGLPNLKLNSKNNAGIGYNYIDDSNIQKSVIENGTFNNNIIGSYSSDNVLEKYLISSSVEYFVKTNRGNYFNNKFINSDINNSSLFSNNIENSLVSNSKSINSELSRTVFLKSKFTSDKIIKIKGYQEKFLSWWDGPEWVSFKLYKFYINQEDVSRLVNFQNFYFQDLKITTPNSDVLNFFDDKFSFDSYISSYDTIQSKRRRRTIVSISNKEDNLRTLSNSLTSNKIVDNLKYHGYASIDLLICATPSSNIQDFNTKEVTELYGPYQFNLTEFQNSPSWNTQASNFEIESSGGIFTFSTIPLVSNIYDELTNLSIGTFTYSGFSLNVEGVYSYNRITLFDSIDSSEVSIFSTRSSRNVIDETFTELDISNAYIIDSDFVSGLFKDSTWITGNYINYNRDHSIEMNINSDRFPSELDNSLSVPKIILPSGPILRKSTLEVGDILFFNGMYYDANLLGGNNLIKMPDTYKIESVFESTTRIFELTDFVNGTSSVLNYIPSSISSPSVVFLTKHAEIAYNYIHPVKFDNSKIESGIFRRAFFTNCIFENQLFNLNDKDPINFNNWRSLLLSDTLFADNGNTIKSALVTNSSFVSGSDKWVNGILYKSIWNVQSFTYSYLIGGTTSQTLSTPVNKFENGIVKNSRWVDGVFANGHFYKNRSNTPFTLSVYDNNESAYYRNRNANNNGYTKYAWLNGTFENGLFELSNFEKGTFIDGDFYNSTFLTGEAKGGNFGKRNLKFPLTRVASGTFSDVNVISSEFRSENPTGEVTGNFEINWLNGIFNNGEFGVKVDLGSYSENKFDYGFKSIWNDGKFNNGSFMDTAVWKNGEFNNGRFKSYYGYPFVTAASYSIVDVTNFAWQNGEFNGGEFGNFNTGTNSTWYTGEFNGGIFSGRYWNNGLFTKGAFYGSGLTDTSLSKVPEFVSGFSDAFYGLWNDGVVSEIKDKFILSKRIFTKLEREFTKKKKKYQVELKNVLWRGGTFSHNSGQVNQSIWLGGVFEKGKFIKSNFNPYTNYLINGYFNITNDATQVPNFEILPSDYIDETSVNYNLEIQDTNRFTSDTAKKLIYSGTSSINLYQTTGLIIGDIYTVKSLVLNNYNTEIRFGSYNKNLRNGNFTEGESYWTLAATSSSGGNLPTFQGATGTPGYIQYTDGASGDTIGYLIYKDILDVGKDYTLRFYTYDESSMAIPYIGSCDSSSVTIDSGILVDDFTVNTNYTYSVPTVGSNIYISSFKAVYTDLIIECRSSSGSTSYKMTSFILSGNAFTLNTSDISSRKMLSYTFIADGADFSLEFIPKRTANTNLPPTVISASSSIFSVEVIKGSSGFNLSDDCRWENGTFEDSEFYISKWNNGKWISGTATGMIWKDGVANYMNAYNIYWEGGTWRNGNWNGSPFTYENFNPNGCNYTYGNTASISYTSPWHNLDLGSGGPPPGVGKYVVTPNSTSGFIFSVEDGAGTITSTYHDPGIDPSGSGNFVDSNGLPFVKTSTTSQFNTNQRYRVTVTIGTVSIPDQLDSDDVNFLFSLGRPSAENPAYGESSGTYEGSIYPDIILLAGADYISNYYSLKSLEGHEGSVVPDLAITGTDGYLATKGGVVSEVLNTKSDGRLYFHINMYGVKEFYVDSISIEQEFCEVRPVVNDGYVSDILTNVAKYRQSIEDISYKEVFINNAFTASTDLDYPNIINAPNLTVTSLTTSVTDYWKYFTQYPYYQTTNCEDNSRAFGFGYFAYNAQVGGKGWLYNNTENFRTTINANSNYMYAVNTLQSYNLFTQSGTFDITIRYMFHFGDPGLNTSNPTGGGAPAPINVGNASKGNHSYSGIPVKAAFKIAGVEEVVQSTITIRRLRCTGNTYWGDSGILTYTKTITRDIDDPLSFNTSSIQIRKINTTNYISLYIVGIDVKNKTIQYDPVYNCATYSIFDDTPSYSDDLILPAIELIGGFSEGNLISTRVGNGMFVSGTASGNSSIWENGVWNEGFRYDKNVYAFSGLGFFSKTEKPYSFSGNIDIKKSKIGTIPSDKDKNLTKIKPSGRTWITVLRRAVGFIEYEGFSVNQFDRIISDFFKVGDRVSVGNIVSIDLNNKRRLIRDPFTVVQIVGDLIYLQITLNFPIRKIDKDSDDHLIYATKNIWTNGAFLNGIFRGVWSNGLFKGRPYITKMVDSQWIDGRFEGGRFRGLTLSLWDNNQADEFSENVTYPSGLIQNFKFRDSDKFTYGNEHKYSSWIDVNYQDTSTVTIFRNTINYDEGGFISGSISYGELARTNHFSIPTNDVLSSLSYLRENNTSNIIPYNLGVKYEEYENFLEDIDFQNYYNTKNSFGTNKFIKDGFTYSEQGYKKKNKYTQQQEVQDAGTFSYLSNVDSLNEGILEIRTVNATGAELTSELGFAPSDGNFNAVGILDNTKATELNKKRYSYVSFDLYGNYIPGNPWATDFLSANGDSSGISIGPTGGYKATPLGINGETLDLDLLIQASLQLTVDKGNSVLPIGFTNILNRTTTSVKEYFYNKNGLKLIPSIFIIGATPSSIKIGSLKMVETDAIPFFLLGTESRINKAIQAPYGSSAPFIDYSNSEFSLIDSIIVTETIFETLENPNSTITSGGLSAPKGSPNNLFADSNVLNQSTVFAAQKQPIVTSSNSAATQTFTSTSKGSKGA
jgi:hypothetical protein